MFTSKPIGWITAVTLFCVAGVALACRLRDGKETTAEANAAACPTTVTEVKDDKSEPAKPADAPKEPEKKQEKKELGEKPAVGELVAPAPPMNEPKSKEDGAKWQPASSLPAPPSAGSDAGPPSPVAPGPVPEAPPKANLLSPEMTKDASPIRPVSASEAAPPAPASADVPARPSEPKKDDTADKKTSEPPTSAPRASPAAAPSVPSPATIPSKEETSIPPAPTASSAAVPTPGPVPTADKTPSPVPMTEKPLYKVRGKSESLREIASRTLGSGERWREISSLNPDLHGDLIVPAGKEVRLPADAKIDAAKCDAPMDGGQAESEHAGPSKPDVTAVRPLPVLRPRMPKASEKSMAPLTGTYSCQMENRSLMLPKEAAEQLGKVETMLLTPGPDRCLWLGTPASVARVLDRVEKSGAADRDVQAFRRLYFAQTEKAAVNDSGKVMVPEKLAEYAGLGKEVVLVGIDDHFELWDASRWQHYSQQKDSSTKP